MVVLRKVGVMSVAKIICIMQAIIGLIVGILLVAVGAAASSFAGDYYRLLGLDSMFGIVTLIIFPIVYGIGGFIGGAIAAALYNFVAGKVGGIEIELGETQPTMGYIPPSTAAPMPADAKYCASCGAMIPTAAKFCKQCGASAP